VDGQGNAIDQTIIRAYQLKEPTVAVPTAARNVGD
jgi:glycerol dehydrogenase-like iron-containing ADH family enzyme